VVQSREPLIVAAAREKGRAFKSREQSEPILRNGIVQLPAAFMVAPRDDLTTRPAPDGWLLRGRRPLWLGCLDFDSESPRPRPLD